MFLEAGPAEDRALLFDTLDEVRLHIMQPDRGKDWPYHVKLVGGD